MIGGDKNAAWTTTFQDYHLPTAPDVPGCKIEHVETPNPLNPLGVKGGGEGGTIPAPAAIIAAIEDALSPFAVRFTQMPLRSCAKRVPMRRSRVHERAFGVIRTDSQGRSEFTAGLAGKLTQIQSFGASRRPAAMCRYCCKSPKLPGANFPAVKKSD